MPVVRFKGNKLDPATITALVTGTLVNGSKPSAWWKRQSADFRNTLMDTVRTSMQNGESLTQAITRVTGGTIDGVTVPGVMKTTKAKAGALVSTSMSAVTNEAALKSFQANNDVIKAVTQVSTLDNKTSDICIAYSGQTWDVNTLAPVSELGSTLPFNGGPPRHFNCRSRLRPVTKSFKELGLDKAEIPVSTRASMDGQVPADITFNQFLKGKPPSFADKLLGPKRAQLWRNGDINLTQLVDMRGNPMTLTQLEQRIGLKPPQKPTLRPQPKPKPKKKTVDSFLENDDGTFVQITQAEYDEIRGYAKTLTERAAAADELVTSQIKGLADDVGAVFPDAPIVKDGPLVKEGSLHYRMKDYDSTSRKIQTYARDRNLTYTEAAEQISDSLRYTYIVDEADYIDAVKATMERFAQLGYKNGKFDAAWFKRPDYRGLNINMISPQGVKMELQFHTAKSFEIKNGINHKLYEEFRKLSKAKQKGPEGQALQAAMKANADTIPFPPNIKELDELAKIYNKPAAELQEKILADAQKRVLFNEMIETSLKDGNYLAARKLILDIGDVVPDSMKKAAVQRIDESRKVAVKKADSLIAEKKFTEIKSRDKFNNTFIELIDEMDDANIDKAVRLEVTDKLKTLRNAQAETFATEEIMVNQLLGTYDEVYKIAADIKDPTPKFKKFMKEVRKEHATFTEKQVRADLMNGDSNAAIKKLMKFGDTDDAPNIQALHKEIQAGTKMANDKVTAIEEFIAKDMDEFSKFVKTQINDDDIPEWVRKKILNDPDFKIAETNAQWAEAVANIEKLTIEGKFDVAADALQAMPDIVYDKQKLKFAIEQGKKKKDDLIKVEFPKKVEAIAKELGYKADDLKLMNLAVEDMATMSGGVVNEQVMTLLQKHLRVGRLQLDDSIKSLKSLNKKSKGLEAITSFIDSKTLSTRQHPDFEAVMKKVMAQAQKKQSIARKEVLDTMIKAGDIDADDILMYGDNLLKDAMKDVTKKLGKAQKQAKINEIKAKIASAKKSDVSVAEYAADPTVYDKQVFNILSKTEIDELNEAVKEFAIDAASNKAKGKMIQLLSGKSMKQERAIKEYVHRRVNPKKLANGSDFDAKVAEIVTKHVNNVDRNVIKAHIEAMTTGESASVKMHFQQTIFTRAGVKKLDDLGINKTQIDNIAAIREELKIHDPGKVPIPAHSADEQLKAAKEWLNASTLDDAAFKDMQLKQSKQIVSNSPALIRKGDKIFGENSWGITQKAWDDWMKNVAPTLDEWDIALIHEYTGGMAGRINAGLYNGGLEQKWTAGAQALNKALDKMPKHTGTVYRGTSTRANWTADYIDARYQVGEEVIERGFGSSATQESARFSGNLVFVIKTKGKSGAIIGHVGQYGTSEMEVLFKAGTKFIVRRKERKGSGITVYMEEV